MSPVAVWEPASGREANAYRLNRIRDHPNAYCRPGRSSTGKTRNQPRKTVGMLCRRRPLVPVGSTPHGASTSGLSNTCSTCGLQRFKTVRNPNLGAGFPLRCFQRLSLPNVANRPCRWRDNRHTRGSSTQVLSYYGQASSGFQRAQRIETKLSHDVSEPSSRAALIGEQPNPWDLLQPQDATSRHRGAKPSRRYGLLGMISLLSPGYLLSVERCRARAPAPDHYLRLSSLLGPSSSQSSPLVRLHSTPDCQPG